MFRQNRHLPLPSICLALVTGLAAQEPPLGCDEIGVISEGAIRQMAIKTYLPAYPEDAIKEGRKGVAVAGLSLDADNRVESGGTPNLD